MDSCKYVKMICNLGHESRAYAEGEALPRRCPVCNQPYDRRYNRPILCYEDGSVPEEITAEPLKTGNDDVSEPSSMEQPDSQGQMSEYEPYDFELPRRGRKVDIEKNNPPLTRGRRESRPINALQTDEPPQKAEAYNQRNLKSGSLSNIGLFNGGDCIKLPEESCCLGREGYASDYLGINPTISRKHAFISVDRLGNVLVKDAGSLNGTYVDDGSGRRRIKPNETAELKIGDSIWLANHLLILGKIQ